jgi:hypothetical protein
MQPQPIGDPGVKNAMKAYRSAFHRPFPIDYMPTYPTEEEAIAHIRSFVERGRPVERADIDMPMEVAIQLGFDPKVYLGED